MPDLPPRRIRCAIWAGWDFRVPMTGEGMGRLLSLLVEGAAESGRVTLLICVRPVNAAGAREMLAALRATEGEDWALHVIGDAVQAADRMPAGTAALLARSDASIGRELFLLGLLGAPLALLRPIWRLLRGSGALRLAVAARRDPVAVAGEAAAALRRLRLPLLRRRADALEAWGRHRQAERRAAREGAASAAPAAPPPPAEPAAPRGPDYALRDLDPASVDAWLSLMADLVVPASIPGRRAIVLPDALMLDFGSRWKPMDLRPGEPLHSWFVSLRANIAVAEAVIAFSRHVAERQAVARLGVDPARIAIVPHAPPDVLPMLPFVPATRRRDAGTRAAAAEMLRRHATVRGWRYLADFPLEHVDYVAVSTQERPSKNLPMAVEALRILVQDRFRGVKMLLTADLGDDPEMPYRQLEGVIRRHGLGLDAVSVPRLPSAEHAALYHAAAVTVHPSFFEGGDAPFPFAESVSVGTPCLMARGPHTEELLDAFPDLAPFVFDPYDAAVLADLIEDTIARRDEVLGLQQAVYATMLRRRWSHVTEEYVAAATGLPLVPVRRLDARPPG